MHFFLQNPLNIPKGKGKKDNYVIFFGPCFPYGILKHLIFKCEQNLFITKTAQWK